MFNMIPNNIRRTMNIGKDRYEYAVTGKYEKSIFIKNLGTKKSCTMFLDRGYSVAVPPSQIKQWIIEKKL